MRRILTILLLCISMLSVASVPPRDASKWAEWQERNTSATQPLGRARVPAATQSYVERTIIPRVPVIMVNFVDYELVSTKEEVDSMFNGRNWTQDDAKGSVRQYFYDQSMGQYDPQFDIFGPVTLSQGYAYYGKNVGNNSTAKVGYMVTEACALTDDEIDFSQYDSDNDGKVDLVFIFYAGFGENDPPTELVPSDEDLLWPHYWNIESAGYGSNQHVFDGKRIYAYEISNELDGYYTTATKNVIAGIGIVCHEYCHGLGLPDLYAVETSSNHKLLGKWDIMDYGPYNDDMHSPPSFSAYERFFMGWLTPTLIIEPDTLTLSHIATSNEAYLIAENDKHNLDGVHPDTTVFYLLENRQKTGWDIDVPGEGMLMTRINFQPSLWSDNHVNTDPTDLGVDLIEADGLTPGINKRDGKWGKAGDLFPYGANEYTGIPNHAITDITMDDGIVRFVYRGGKTATPVELVKDDADATDLKVYKTIRNGQMLIELNGIYYNILGNKLY